MLLLVIFSAVMKFGVLEQLLYPKGLLQSIRLFWWLEIQ